MKICGVVVLYNPSRDINIKISSYIDKIDKLFVIDNSCIDNSNLLLKDDRIVYIPNFENLGISKALNIAASIAFDEKYDWILTMDQDSCFEDDNLDKLINYSKECDYSKVGIISPWHKTKANSAKPNKLIEEKIEVMTSGNLVNLKAWKKVSGWKDWFFIDNVDIEFCMNLNVNQYKVIRLNSSELDHNLGDISIKKVLRRKFVCSNHNYIRQYYMVRNLYYLKDMYYNYYPDYINYMIRGMRGRARNIIVWEKDKYRKIRNMIRGYRDYKKKIKGIYNYKD
jgi:rhamnosyltransferase